jgi:hypothetical protein
MSEKHVPWNSRQTRGNNIYEHEIRDNQGRLIASLTAPDDVRHPMDRGAALEIARTTSEIRRSHNSLPEVLAALLHASMSCHHSACKARTGSQEECGCHVGRAKKALDAMKEDTGELPWAPALAPPESVGTVPGVVAALDNLLAYFATYEKDYGEKIQPLEDGREALATWRTHPDKKQEEGEHEPTG